MLDYKYEEMLHRIILEYQGTLTIVAALITDAENSKSAALEIGAMLANIDGHRKKLEEQNNRNPTDFIDEWQRRQQGDVGVDDNA